MNLLNGNIFQSQGHCAFDLLTLKTIEVLHSKGHSFNVCYLFDLVCPLIVHLLLMSNLPTKYQITKSCFLELLIENYLVYRQTNSLTDMSLAIYSHFFQGGHNKMKDVTCMTKSHKSLILSLKVLLLFYLIVSKGNQNLYSHKGELKVHWHPISTNS